MNPKLEKLTFPRITLASNYSTRQITKHLTETPVDKSLILDTYRKLNGLQADHSHEMFQGVLFEIHIGLVIQALINCNDSIERLAIADGSNTENFLFHNGTTSPWSVKVFNRHTMASYTEYDNLVRSTGSLKLPILIEGSSGSRVAQQHSRNMIQEKIDVKLLPLSEICETTELGDIYTLPNMPGYTYSEPPDFKVFRENGGHIAIVPIDRQDFSEWAQVTYLRLRT